MMKKILAILVALVLCLAFVAGCADEEKKVKETALDKQILAKIGDYEISQADYNCHYYIVFSNYASYSQYFGEEWLDTDLGEGITLSEQIKNETQAQIEEMAVATKLAEERFGITGKDVKDKAKKDLDELIKSFETKKEFEKMYYEDAQLSEKAFLKYFEMYEIYALFAEKLEEDAGEFAVPDEEVKEYLKDYPRVRHILIATESVDGTSPSRSDEEAMKIVNEIFAKLENGEDFKKLVDEYGEDPGMETNDYYVCGYGQMVPEFEDASIALKEGEYTNPSVKSDYGYHIIKRYAHDETSEEFKEQKSMLMQDKLYEVISAEAKALDVEWDTAAIDEYIKTWNEKMMEITSQN